MWISLIRHFIFGRFGNQEEWIRFRLDLNRIVHLFGEQHIPRLSLAALLNESLNLPDIFVRPLERTAYGVTAEELVALCTITKHLRPQNIVEFGTFDGRSTLHFALNSESDTMVTTIDVQAGEFDFQGDPAIARTVRIGECFSADRLRNRINSIQGDSRSVELSDLAGAVDLIFIDADHSKDAVLKDSRRALELKASNGWVIWHDYRVIRGVTEALDDLSRQIPLFNVSGTSLVVHRAQRICPSLDKTAQGVVGSV